MAGEVLNMSNLAMNIHRCKLKNLCFKTATKPYTYRSHTLNGYIFLTHGKNSVSQKSILRTNN